MIRTLSIVAMAGLFSVIACNKQNESHDSEYPVTSYEERKDNELRPASRTASATATT